MLKRIYRLEFYCYRIIAYIYDYKRFKNSIILRNLFMLIWQMYILFDGEENSYFIR